MVLAFIIGIICGELALMVALAFCKTASDGDRHIKEIPADDTYGRACNYLLTEKNQ